MKKVICVDAKGLPELTNGKEYEVKNDLDDQYYIENDNGRYGPYFHYRFRPVPEQEFQYGQEVEVKDCGTWRKGKIVAVNENMAWVNCESFHLVSDFMYIRPVQSMREKVVEILQTLRKDQISEHVKSVDPYADRIIELLTKK